MIINIFRSSLLSLDVSHNAIADLIGAVSVLEKLPCLKSLIFCGNPAAVSIINHTSRLIFMNDPKLCIKWPKIGFTWKYRRVHACIKHITNYNYCMLVCFMWPTWKWQNVIFSNCFFFSFSFFQALAVHVWHHRDNTCTEWIVWTCIPVPARMASDVHGQCCIYDALRAWGCSDLLHN